MSLIYTVVAREDVLLAEFTPFSGNFVLTAQQILKRCSPTRKYGKFSASSYIFYVLYEDLIYLVMADAKYSERIAFAFLDNIRKLFLSNYPLDRANKLQMYGAMDFAPVLRGNMELYNSPEEVDNVAKLWKETEEVNQILNEDLQKLLEREEKIELLVKKTETMSALSLDMVGSTRTIKRAMIWENWKMRICIFFTVLLVIYFIMIMVCGGVTLSGCF